MLERPISKAEWTRVAFGDVVRLSKARVIDPEAAGIERVIGLEHIEPGDLRIRRWGDVSNGTTFTTRFKPGQVLFGKRRAYQRKVAVADFEGVCSGDIYVFEPANDRLMPELLPFLCQTDAFFDHAVGTSAGSLSPRTNWTNLASFEFLLPPIKEQARLVSFLSTANALICNYKTILELGTLLTNSILDQAWSLNDKGTNLGALIEFGPKNGIYKPVTDYGTGTRIIRIDAFKRGRLTNESEWKRLRLKVDDVEEFSVTHQDILINRVNSRDFVGQAAFVGNLNETAVFESNIMRLRLDQSLSSPNFICAIINHPKVRRQISERKKDAINQSSINQDDVRSLEIPDLTLVEQKRILVALDDSAARLEDVLKRKNELARAIPFATSAFFEA